MQLREDLGSTGTVFVWNKSFEMTRNKELAIIYPEYAEFLAELNKRIYDLGDFINLGFYLHPKFKGSWSIKNVLPVMVPELGYDEMEIGKGDQAMMAWWELIHDKLSTDDAEKTKTALLEYCKMDTWAMVKIWEKLVEFGNYAVNEVSQMLSEGNLTDKQLNYLKRISSFWLKAGRFERQNFDHILFGEDYRKKVPEDIIKKIKGIMGYLCLKYINFKYWGFD